MDQRDSSFAGSNWLLYAALCAPLLFVAFECARGAYCDVQLIRTSTLRLEMSRLRAQAIKRATNLESGLQMRGGEQHDWTALRRQPWLQTYWGGIVAGEPEQMYAAVVDRRGVIVLHTNPVFAGKDLGRRWYEETVPEAGSDVVRLPAESVLTPATEAYDVRVPLIVNDQEVGEYHEGFDAAWFDSKVAGLQREVLARWGWILALAIAVDAAGVAALWILARRHRELLQTVHQGSRERAGQIGQIASGLAHEIRNPLHALRINLHALRRSFNGRMQLNPEDVLATINQSDSAIDSLERLMRDLLRFTARDGGQKSDVNLASEIRATLNLMSEDMRRKQIDIETRIPSQPVTVAIDPDRLRQALMNLLTFAQNRAGPRGRIEVELSRRERLAEMTISDSGPALTDAQQARVFEPFRAPRETGSGLGLALVQSFAEEAGGTALCESRPPAGCRLRVLLPVSNCTQGI